MEQHEFLSSSIPVGTVIAFAGEKNNIPKGWLPCEGQIFSKEDYSELFNVIGTIWGGSGTPNFYLPDLRGLFLRGVSGETNVDPDKDDRYAPQLQHSPSNPGNRGNVVGSLQGDTFKSHDHSFQDPGHAHGFTKGGTIDMWGGNIVPSGGPGGPGGVAVAGTNIRFNREGGDETRPINAYVYFIIKVK
jgi:hypothetical protein